jgi:hypothetical protein
MAAGRRLLPEYSKYLTAEQGQFFNEKKKKFFKTAGQ